MIGDFLKKYRDDGYSGKEPKKPEPEKDSDKKMGDHPRVISLTDEETSQFQGVKPGEDLACEVHGTLAEDGVFRVMSVKPLGGEPGYGSDQEMAGQVAQRVTPSVQLSPS